MVCHSYGTIINSSVNNVSLNAPDLSNSRYAGGLVSFLYSGTIINSSVNNVSLNVLSKFAGFLVGHIEGKIENSFYNYNNSFLNGLNVKTALYLYEEDYDLWILNNKTYFNPDSYLTQESNYYLINNISDFEKVNYYLSPYNLKFRFNNSLDFTGNDDLYIKYLYGSLDGNNKTISNLNINSEFSQVGLLGSLYGNVSNLRLFNSSITSLGYYVGGLIGLASFDNLTNQFINLLIINSTISGSGHIGGLIGSISGDNITFENGNANTNVTIFGTSHYVGGLMGSLSGDDNIVFNSSVSNNINIQGRQYTGGLVGYYSGSNSIILNSFVSKNIIIDSSWSQVGGLVGYQNGGTISDSSVSSNVSISGVQDSVGGLVGQFISGAISNSSVSSNIIISGNYYVGGLVGYQNGNINKSYVGRSVNVSGSILTGGFTGRLRSGKILENSFSAAKVSSSGTDVNGFVGLNEGTIINSYWLNTTDNPSSCSSTGNENCTAITDVSYFFNYSNSPMNFWDFVGTWDNVLEGLYFPSLISQQATRFLGYNMTEPLNGSIVVESENVSLTSEFYLDDVELINVTFNLFDDNDVFVDDAEGVVDSGVDVNVTWTIPLLIDGDYKWNFSGYFDYYNDIVYFESNTTNSFKLNSVAPNITIFSPIAQDYVSGTNSIDFNHSIEYDNPAGTLDTCWYNLNYTTNITIACNTNTTLVGLVDEIYSLKFYVNTTIGQLSIEELNFSIGSYLNSTIIYPVNNTYFDVFDVIINVSVLPHLIYADNITLFLWNSSLFNSSTQIITGLQDQNVSWDYYDLVDGEYFFNASLYGRSVNNESFYNETVLNKFIIDTTLPIMESISYTPNSENGIDPETQINVSINVTEINVQSVLLQYKNATDLYWTNASMVLSSGLYEGDFTTGSDETNYSFRIFVEDLAGNTNYTSETNISSYWDCSWTLTPGSLDEVIGYYENKYIGNVTVTNTGDVNHSACIVEYTPNFVSNSFSIDYYASGNFIDTGRGLSFNPSGAFSLSPNQERNLSVYVYLPTVEDSLQEEPRVIVTSNVTDTVADDTDKYTNTTVIISQPGPYLYQEINSYPTVVSLVPGNFSLSSSLKNLAGDNTDNNTAYNVSYNWTINSDLIAYTDGNRTLEYENLTNNSEITNLLDFNFTSSNLDDFPDDLVGESIEFKTYLYGHENNSDLITHADNVTYLQETFSISFVCDPDEITNTAPACKPTTVTETITTGGGGGGGGNSGIVQQSEANFELVTGEKQEFILPIENKYPYSIRDVVVTVSGINAEFIKIKPETIKEIKPNSTYSVTVKITAPAYFNEGYHDLNFKIKGNVDVNGKISSYSDTKLISLFILEVSRDDASEVMDLAYEKLIEMNITNANLKDILEIIEDMKLAYKNIEFNSLTSLSNELDDIHDAFSEFNDIKSMMMKSYERAEENGVDVFESKKLMSLAEAAYNRGKFVHALDRIKEASLTLAVEMKGEFNPWYYVKNNPFESIAIFFGALLFGISSTFTLRYNLYKKKIKLLGQEEKLLFELMKVMQSECFKFHRMSMDEYTEAIMQYEKRLGVVVEGRIKTETKIRNMFKMNGKKKALVEEKKEVIGRIRKIQDQYLNKGTLETRLYENMLKTYSTRLAEVEEELTFLDAKESGVKIPRRFKK